MPKWEVGLIALVINIIFVIIVFKIIDVADKKLIKKLQEKDDDTPLLRFLPIIVKVIKAIILFIALTGLLQSQGYSISSILAGFGIGGIAVGMAAKDALANIFGTINILSDRIYKIGDYVKINGIEGYVEDINMCSTKIRDLDHFLTSIPNNVVANATVVNVSNARERFLNITFGLTYSTDNEHLALAQEILKTIAINHREIHNEFTVCLHDLGDSSINVRFRGYVKSGSYDTFLRVRGEFLSEVVKEYRKAGIDFAFPSRSIYIESDNTKLEN